MRIVFTFFQCSHNIIEVYTHAALRIRRSSSAASAMQYIYHIAPNKKGEEGGYEKERGNGNYRQPTTDDVGEFGSSAGQTRSNKLTRQMKRKVDFSGTWREPPNTQNN